MSDITIISACFGGYDTVKTPTLQTVDVDWLLVTDEPDIVAPGWNVIVEKRPHVHPNIAAKLPKFRSDLYTSSRFTVWADASAVMEPDFARTVVSRITPGVWAMFPHPDRSNMRDEVEASRGLPKYDGMDLEGQIEFYLSDGHDVNYGLWATGVIGRDRSMLERDIQFGNEWLLQNVRWSFQDQLSFVYLARRFGLPINVIGADLWNNSIVWFDDHGR